VHGEPFLVCTVLCGSRLGWGGKNVSACSPARVADHKSGGTGEWEKSYMRRSSPNKIGWGRQSKTAWMRNTVHSRINLSRQLQFWNGKRGIQYTSLFRDARKRSDSSSVRRSGSRKKTRSTSKSCVI